jgi:AraC-like DNA-binding protein
VILAEGLLQGRRAPLLHIGRARALMAGALPAGPGPIAQDRPFLTLLLPRDETLPDAGAPAGTGVGIDAMRGQGALLAQFLWNLSEQIGQVPQDRLGSVASAARALVMACLDQAAMTPRLVAQENHPPLAAFIERARLGVRENMASPEFGPRELARLLAMSRSKLYRLLLKEGGVAHFINRERLLQARSCLAAQEGPVSIHAVAAQVGFRDHSTFSRAFRREFGVTPSEARQVSPFRLSEPFGKVS